MELCSPPRLLDPVQRKAIRLTNVRVVAFNLQSPLITRQVYHHLLLRIICYRFVKTVWKSLLLLGLRVYPECRGKIIFYKSIPFFFRLMRSERLLVFILLTTSNLPVSIDSHLDVSTRVHFTVSFDYAACTNCKFHYMVRTSYSRKNEFCKPKIYCTQGLGEPP